jgi:transcriptional regulator with XRE-family HTH domain
MPRPASARTGLMLRSRFPWFGVSPLADPSAAAAIGARLARLRKERGITQAELAQRLGISQPMVSDYERGALRLHGELILELTAILDVTADELLGRPGEADSRDPSRARNRRLMRRLQRVEALPKRDQDALMRTIDAFLARAPVVQEEDDQAA